MKKFLLSIAFISASYGATNKDELPYPRNFHIYGESGVSEAAYNELNAKYKELLGKNDGEKDEKGERGGEKKVGWDVREKGEFGFISKASYEKYPEEQQGAYRKMLENYYHYKYGENLKAGEKQQKEGEKTSDIVYQIFSDEQGVTLEKFQEFLRSHRPTFEKNPPEELMSFKVKEDSEWVKLFDSYKNFEPRPLKDLLSSSSSSESDAPNHYEKSIQDYINQGNTLMAYPSFWKGKDGDLKRFFKQRHDFEEQALSAINKTLEEIDKASKKEGISKEQIEKLQKQREELHKTQQIILELMRLGAEEEKIVEELENISNGKATEDSKDEETLERQLIIIQEKRQHLNPRSEIAEDGEASPKLISILTSIIINERINSEMTLLNTESKEGAQKAIKDLQNPDSELYKWIIQHAREMPLEEKKKILDQHITNLMMQEEWRKELKRLDIAGKALQNSILEKINGERVEILRKKGKANERLEALNKDTKMKPSNKEQSIRNVRELLKNLEKKMQDSVKEERKIIAEMGKENINAQAIKNYDEINASVKNFWPKGAEEEVGEVEKNQAYEKRLQDFREKISHWTLNEKVDYAEKTFNILTREREKNSQAFDADVQNTHDQKKAGWEEARKNIPQTVEKKEVKQTDEEIYYKAQAERYEELKNKSDRTPEETQNMNALKAWLEEADKGAMQKKNQPQNTSEKLKSVIDNGQGLVNSFSNLLE